MKILIATISCQRDRDSGRQQVARDTWLAEWGHLVDHKFWLGGACEDQAEDELIFPVDDTFMGVPFKTQAGHRWAYEQGYDYVFISSLDTYVIVPRLLEYDLAGRQYVGHLYEGYITGVGYWLGRDALQAIAAATPEFAYEDKWVGGVLAAAGIGPSADPRYCGQDQHGPPFPYDDPGVWARDIFAVHLGRGTGNFDPQWMRDCHASYMRNR
jgi:hypothetical protein